MNTVGFLGDSLESLKIISNIASSELPSEGEINKLDPKYLNILHSDCNNLIVEIQDEIEKLYNQADVLSSDTEMSKHYNESELLGRRLLNIEYIKSLVSSQLSRSEEMGRMYFD